MRLRAKGIITEAKRNYAINTKMVTIITSKIGKAYGASDGKNVYINPKKNRSGIEYMDTSIHESLHNRYPKMKEKDIIEKSKKIRLSTLAII